MKVLVVDDHTTMRRIIRNQLNAMGHAHVEEAADGGEALTKLRAGTFDLVISDWAMDPMTGYDLLRSVRADTELTSTRFIMITSDARTEKLAAANTAGVDGYIVKPFDAATLRNRIDAAVRRAS